MRIDLNIIPLDKSPKDICAQLDKGDVVHSGTLRDRAKRHDYNLYFQQLDRWANRFTSEEQWTWAKPIYEATKADPVLVSCIYRRPQIFGKNWLPHHAVILCPDDANKSMMPALLWLPTGSRRITAMWGRASWQGWLDLAPGDIVDESLIALPPAPPVEPQPTLKKLQALGDDPFADKPVAAGRREGTVTDTYDGTPRHAMFGTDQEMYDAISGHFADDLQRRQFGKTLTFAM